MCSASHSELLQSTQNLKKKIFNCEKYTLVIAEFEAGNNNASRYFFLNAILSFV